MVFGIRINKFFELFNEDGTLRPKYIFTDIHGCYDTFVALLDKLPNKGIGLDVIITGDIVDRGNDSLKIIDLIIERGYLCLLGNHEDMLLKWYGPELENIYGDTWIQNGGYFLERELTLLKKFNPHRFNKYMDFFKNLKYYAILPDEYNINNRKVLLTHAPSNYFFELGNALSKDDRFNMIWNRTIHNDIDKNYFNICGHNPSRMFERVNHPNLTEEKVLLRDDLASIDTSCSYGEMLTCLILPSKEIIQQKNVEVPDRTEVQQTRGYNG